MRKSIFMIMVGLLLVVPAFAANKAPQKELIVASDGEFTTITAALASLPDPNTTPVVIKVMPGTYTESFTLKSNIHLQGAGYNVTKIVHGETWDVITINGISDIEISGFTIENSTGNRDSIHIESSSPIIRNNRFLGGYPIGIRDATSQPLISENIFETNLYIWVKVSAAPTISNNRFLLSGRYGIDAQSDATVNINGNVFEGNGSTCFAAINIFSAAISGNTITNFACNGISIYINGNSIITNNKITGNSTDIYLGTGTSANLNFNVFDTIYGAVPSSLNVKSDGTPW